MFEFKDYYVNGGKKIIGEDSGLRKVCIKLVLSGTVEAYFFKLKQKKKKWVFLCCVQYGQISELITHID